MTFQLPSLLYWLDALEPFIDKKTMEIHHGKHHAAYITNLNTAIAGTPMEKMSIEDLCGNASKIPAAVRNNGGGHYNHSLFWSILAPAPSRAPSGILSEAIAAAFGSFDEMKARFSAAAATRFGSGWAWLVVSGGKLQAGSSPNQDNPLMDVSDLKGAPILGLDVWEHAYYLNYQNRRADYIAAFWNIVNWEEVARRYAACP